MRILSNPTRRNALLFATVLLGACGSDPVAPEADAPPPIARWAGSYNSAARFGASNGTWGNGGTFQMVISNTGQITVSGSLVQSPVYNQSTSMLSWRRADGNATNGEVTFREAYTSDFFFRDRANASTGQNFTGFIQRGGEGKLDYRGMLR